MARTVIMDHPLIQHKIGIIRKKDTSSKEFREMISEIAMLMCYEATRELPLTDVEIETPICKTTVKELEGKKMAVVPILRAGLGMVEGMLAMIPAAKIGHIGLYRDEETHEPHEYYCKLPDPIDERLIVVTDPMLATGGSAVVRDRRASSHIQVSISSSCRSSLHRRELRDFSRLILTSSSTLVMLTAS